MFNYKVKSKEIAAQIKSLAEDYKATHEALSQEGIYKENHINHELERRRSSSLAQINRAFQEQERELKRIKEKADNALERERRPIINDPVARQYENQAIVNDTMDMNADELINYYDEIVAEGSLLKKLEAERVLQSKLNRLGDDGLLQRQQFKDKKTGSMTETEKNAFQAKEIAVNGERILKIVHPQAVEVFQEQTTGKEYLDYDHVIQSMNQGFSKIQVDKNKTLENMIDESA